MEIDRRMVAKVTKDGRIILWEGASLWAFDVLPGNQPASNRMHSHHAFQLTLAAGGGVGIRTDQGLVPGPVILIAPDVPHAIEAEGRIALLFVDPESRAGAGLKQLLAGMRLLDLVLGCRTHRSELDPRIERVLDRLSERSERGITATEAAGIACLSESRFSHLFVEQVGLPFRTFLLWRRLMRAVEQLAGGKRLTEAAHHAGFADSAHFSRTFQRMFGLPAASLELTSLED
ncbi:helix-turn-helix domain-containing protein [Sinorhizobium meliloti]|uniref:helix-turn-helix domain-containing protein n=1 Tax=Rhizobium meliloti TaxID=382 RepID=UPI0023801D15|nr:AraC family transcriptional regulator [Sinorhizobium meliloti]MDE3820112.1 helix-turn-helix domain-containing protein [Sinorhizobium meliloti]